MHAQIDIVERALIILITLIIIIIIYFYKKKLTLSLDSLLVSFL